MKLSITVPYHDTPKTALFLSRLLKSVSEQTFTDYEIVLTKNGGMARNQNTAIQQSKGDIIKIIHMDDYLAHPYVLQEIVDTFDANPEKQWYISASTHTRDGQTTFNDHMPQWTEDIFTGNNRLGGMSTISLRRDTDMLFEEPLTWMIDCDWYYRMYLKYGLPMLGEKPAVVVDVRDDRMTGTIPDVLKQEEIYYLMKKYGR